MKSRYFFLLLIFTPLVFLAQTNWFLFGMKSRDNSIENIQQIEKKHELDIPIVAFIFDPRWDHVVKMMDTFTTKLWEDKIYHITLSPNSFSAKDVSQWKFDNQYKQFFDLIKKNNLRVIFRTMHEMNGGRYPWSSNPYRFKKARIHVRNISREQWLNSENILFDMSLNAWDLPAKWWKPNQKAVFIQCQKNVKAKLKCSTFEDYYPWDKYVDLLGVTFYNRGKGNSNRRRWTPYQIVNAKWRETLNRMKKFSKPIFVDEVWTTAVNYTWAYDFKKSLEVYNNNKDLKNQRLVELKNFMLKETRIAWMIYFNVDLTNWLQSRTLGELDRSVIDFASNKFYEKILDIYDAGSKVDDNAILNLFNIRLINLNWMKFFVRSDYVAPINNIFHLVSLKYDTMSGKLEWLEELKNDWTLHGMFKRFDDNELNQIIESVKKIIEGKTRNNYK